MTQDEFQAAIAADPALAGPVRKAAAAATPTAFGGVTEAAAVALLFPVASYVLRNIGLPWLYEAKRYAELWRLKFHAWVDGQYEKHGLDPDRAEKAGDALRDELAKTTDTGARAAWERLAQLLAKDAPKKAE